jgi:hypothetical protein
MKECSYNTRLSIQKPEILKSPHPIVRKTEVGEHVTGESYNGAAAVPGRIKNKKLQIEKNPIMNTQYPISKENPAGMIS